jgi:hypothetical protein
MQRLQEFEGEDAIIDAATEDAEGDLSSQPILGPGLPDN